MSDGYGTIVSEITPGKVISTFATGLDDPVVLAFNASGDLFEADSLSGHIYEFLNNGGALSPTPVAFQSGLNHPTALAFDASGDLFVTEQANGDLAEIKANGSESVFASGFGLPTSLAISGAALPVPELSLAVLSTIGGFFLMLVRRKEWRSDQLK